MGWRRVVVEEVEDTLHGRRIHVISHSEGVCKAVPQQLRSFDVGAAEHKGGTEFITAQWHLPSIDRPWQIRQSSHQFWLIP